MSEVEPKGKRNPLLMFFGACLMAVGALIATLCGLCTVAVSGSMLATGGGSGGVDPSGTVLILFLFGGLPTLFGVAVFGVGVWLVRHRPPATGDRGRE
jgi:hypothetical protein